MNVSERILTQGSTHMVDNKTANSCYMVNDQGKEIQITTAMVHHVCHQLLKQCRTVKN